MRPFSRFNRFFSKLPTNLAIGVIVLLWFVPTVGVLVSSFRTREAVRTTGWWNTFLPKPVEGEQEYTTYCASCHGDDGAAIATADLIDPRGGNWHILTGAAFLSFLVPMAIFFGLQRFFVRGLTSGAVKG